MQNIIRKKKKGQFGYMDYQKKFTLARSAAYFGISLALYLVGRITTESNANLLTIVAVLGCLPASKSLVNAIMFLRTRECSGGLHARIEEKLTALGLAAPDGGYDFLLTSYDANFAFSHLVIRGSSLCGITESAKFDAAKAQTHLEEMFRQNSFNGMTFKVFTDSKKYLERLEQLARLEPGGQEREMLELVKNLSL